MRPFNRCVYLGKERTFPINDEPVSLKKGMVCDVKLHEPTADHTAYKMSIDLNGHAVDIFYQSMVDVYIDWLNVKKG